MRPDRRTERLTGSDGMRRATVPVETGVGILNPAPRDRTRHVSALPTEPPDSGQPDLYWAGVSGWAMLPAALVGGAVSAVAMLAGPRLGSLVGLPADWTTFVLFWLTVAAWITARAGLDVPGGQLRASD